MIKKIIGIFLLLGAGTFIVGTIFIMIWGEDSLFNSDKSLWAQLISYSIVLSLYLGISYIGLRLFRTKSNIPTASWEWGEFGKLYLLLTIIFIGGGIIAIQEEKTALAIGALIGGVKFLISFIKSISN